MKRIFSVMLTVLLLLSTAGCDQVSGLIPSVLTPGAVSGTLTAAATIPPATPEPGGSSTPAGSVTQTAAVGNGTPQALITQNPGAEETLPEASGALTIWLPPLLILRVEHRLAIYSPLAWKLLRLNMAYP